MNKRDVIWILVLLFLLTLGARLYFTFQTPYFSSDYAYFNLRQVESIASTGLPFYYDELSYGGRELIILPFFHYLLAAFSFIFPLEIIAKILPNIFASTIVFIIYLTVQYITKSRGIALLSAFVGASVPIFFLRTMNSVSVHALAIPLSFLVLYFFMRLKEKRWTYWFVFVFILLMITSPVIVLVVLSLVFYYFLTKIEKLNLEGEEKESIVFSLLLMLWFYFIIFKRAFLAHGFSLIWQNIPAEIISNYFYPITINQAIFHIGVIPILGAVFVAYFYLFQSKNKHLYLFLSLAITLMLLLWANLLKLETGLLYLSICCVILFGVACKQRLDYVENTRIKAYAKLILVIIFVLSVSSLTVPTLYLAAEQKPSYDLYAFSYLQEQDPDAVVVASPLDGHAIAYYADKATVTDSNFLLINDLRERIEDTKTIFTGQSKVVAGKFMEKYDVKYIYLSPEARQLYEISALPYEEDECFPLVYSGSTKLYERRCLA